MFNKITILISLNLLVNNSITSQSAINIPDNFSTHDISIDDEGNSYIIGLYDGASNFDFDITTQEVTIDENNTFYIASYNQDNKLRFAFSLEDLSPLNLGILNFNSPLIKNDVHGNIYITGIINGWIDFDPSSNVSDILTTNFQNNGFLVSYDKDGNFNY